MLSLKRWVPLLLLAFAAGFLLARLWPVVAVPPEALMVASPTLVPATPTPILTPTATTPDVERAAAGDTLDTLYIDIAPDDFAQIQAKREAALAQWILLASSADLVPATLRLGDDAPLSARLRLKGDWADHFAHAKWSYRVEMRGANFLNGMRVFSLQDPSTRTYLNEWLFLENLRAEGVLAVGYDFVHGVQNGQALGIYAVEEGFSKELLESQGRRESVIIRYNEDLLWQYWAAYNHDNVTPRGVRELYVIDEFDSNKVNQSTTLSAYRDVAVGKLRAWWAGKSSSDVLDDLPRQLPSAEVFDRDTLAKFLALADVWGASHAIYWHNLRFYYNPITTLLEPIAFDTQALAAGSHVEVLELPGLREVQTYADPQLQRAYLTSLWQFSQPDYLTALQADFGTEFEALRAALTPEFGARYLSDGQSVLAPPWEVLTIRQAALRELLSPIQMTYAYIPADTTPDTLAVGNLLDFPVEILGVQVDAAWLPATRAWATDADSVLPAAIVTAALVLPALPRDATFMDYARLHIPPETWATANITATAPTLQLVTHLWGLTATVTQPVLASYPPLSTGPLPLAPTLTEALQAHSYLRMMPAVPAMLMIPPGTWAISGSLILPAGYGLHLDPATTLRFAPDSFLLARGPLVFEGTPDQPVILEPSAATWWGVVVLDAGAPSFWHHTVVAHTDAVALPGWTLTGGVTFYQSPIRLDHVHILGTRAEDGFNTIRTTFEIVDSEFAGTVSDALDADFCQGTIANSVFHDIGADGIDVSGADVTVRDVQMFALGDKALSVGEASRLHAERVTITDVDFGVVSKDRSSVTLRDVTIDNARIAGLAAYIKKPAYGPAVITADAITFVNIPDEQQTLIQTGSRIVLDGVVLWGVDVDIEALYEKW